MDKPQTLMRRDALRQKRSRLSDDDAAASAALCAERARALANLNLQLQPELPVSAAAEEIQGLLRAHQVVVVAGETGSGKTTQLPKMLLAQGLGVRGTIAHTQPRRLAARTVAQRIADETGSPLGDAVGYAVRFSDQVGEQTLLKVMTDGLLLTEIRTDRFLDSYDAIIIDEAHERSLNIDFLLGYLKRLLSKRRDLKVVITSATIDVQRFSEFFDGAPVVEVGGRTFPVEVVYQGPSEDLADGVITALEDIETRPHQGASDVLAFFSGEREIFEVARALRRHFGEHLEILPLYARLSLAEQRKVFAPSRARRRVVLATNVAETSITVPNIGFVIDPGFARVNRYSYRSKLQRLPVEPVAQASADQRKGRCGRIAPGVCFRLYDEHDYLSRPQFSDPEIHRVNLASVVLQMEAFNLGQIQRYPFVDPPDPRAVKDAVRLLGELGALDSGKLTSAGRQMARLPIDPRLARMLIEAHKLGSLRELLIITAALSVQDPRERPMAKAAAADQAHEKFADERSDFVSLLNLWAWLETLRESNSRNRVNRLLAKQFVNPTRVREWREVHRQLRQVCRSLSFRENDTPAKFAAVHEAVVSGSLSLVATHDERGQYLGARNLKMRLFPGSGLAGKRPRWVVAAEVAETARVYARCVAQVEPGWIENQGRHLLKSRLSEPFWSMRAGEAQAWETVSLYGLVLADKRRTSVARHDPALARDMMIREGLVPGAVQDPPPFLQSNLDEIRRVQDLEAKGRRRDLLLSDDELYAFYAERLPGHICRLSDLRKWLRKASADDAAALVMPEAFFARAHQAGLSEEDYPAELVFDRVQLALRYRFAPGTPHDGVTVEVPLGVLQEVSAEALEWSVPGLFPLVVEQWLRSLPKQKRKQLAPLPDKVTELSESLMNPSRYRQGRLLAALADLLADRYRLHVSEMDWNRERIDAHLLMYVRILDDDGKVLASGRDLVSLRQELASGDVGDEADNVSAEASAQTGLTSFPEVGLEEHMLMGSGRARRVVYPGLVDSGAQVDLQHFTTRAARDQAHRPGLARLALMALGQVGRYFKKEMDRHPQLGLHFVALGDAQRLRDEVLLNVIWYCFFEDRPLPQDADAFAARLAAHKGELAGVFTETVALFARVMALRFECVRKLQALTSPAYQPSVADMQQHLERLVPADVLAHTPRRMLGLLPRYLEGMEWRIDNLPGHVQRDIANQATPAQLQQRVQTMLDSELFDRLRWQELVFLIEELRLHVFAENVARRRVKGHPLDSAWFGKQWKASAKRVGQIVLEEERRLGLA